MGLLQALDHRAPEQSSFHASAHIPFAARKLSGSSVVWFNRRYFLEHGLNVWDEAILAALCSEIDACFSYAVPQAHEPVGAFTSQQKIFFADRYGGWGISTHAGSGRCGTVGSFQVKGIGQTPLVGAGADYLHSHGAVTLEEAIREAIFGEVANDEMPHGALPVVAIIATGTCMAWGESKALIVRPNFFRASCFERVIDHRPCRPDNFQHMADVARVRGLIGQVVEATSNERARIGVHVKDFHQFIDRSIDQLAYMHMHRLHFGAFTPSNLTINGELLDYGAARATPNWERIVDEWPGVGLDDLETFAAGCKELQFYLGKHAAKSAFARAPQTIENYVNATYRKAFAREVLRLFRLQQGDCDAATEESLAQLFLGYFANQQRIRPSLLSPQRRDPAPWIHDALKDCSDEEGSDETRLVLEVHRLLTTAFGNRPDAERRINRCLAHLRRLSMPRPALFREDLTKTIYREVQPHHGQYAPAPVLARRIQSLVERVRSSSRRAFEWISDDFLIHGSVTRDDTVAAYCTSPDGWPVFCLRAVRHADTASFFQHKIGLPAPDLHDRLSLHLITTATPEASYVGEATTVTVFGVELRIPALDVLY